MQNATSKLIGLYLNILALIAPRTAARMAFQLFCYPFRKKITKRHQLFFQSANQVKHQCEENTIQVYTWGKGEKNILMLHGWQSHSYRWKNYVDTIDKDTYTVYAIDAPGHGLSSGSFMTVPLYSNAIKTIIHKIGKIHAVVGHSIGSFTALYTFYNYPAITPDKLILIASPGEAMEFFKFYKLRLGLSTRCLRLTIKKFEEVIQQKPSYFSAPYFAKHLTIPGLIIHDEEDEETSVENAKAIYHSWKNSKLILTKGKGHNLKTPEVIQHVINFIDHEHKHDCTPT